MPLLFLLFPPSSFQRYTLNNGFMWNGTKVPGKMAWSDSTPDWVSRRKMVGSSGKSGSGGRREDGGGRVAPFYLPTEKQVVNVYVNV